MITDTTSAVDQPDPRQLMEAMAANNPAFRELGVEIIEAGAQRSRFAMRVKPQHTNTFGVCHGGVTFALADLAFGFTCNARGERSMTAGASIEYLAPIPLGAYLYADVTEAAIKGRNVYYDVRLHLEDGTTTAIARGRMRILGGPVITDPEANS
ncbi:PaaI family thioesterase [Filomicrobium sp.]|uniref:PaaI family thioesterase n=1 Tax=Filomicrobium sp. TaxID=2024831 RepID=UPI0025863836|nr:PaaI family thioesterase [Filomicrobium sp.]MCV0370946.1 PaaI family thioesterase [Filomicrobium sp.]